MKKIIFVLFILFLSFSLIRTRAENEIEITETDVNKIKNAVEIIPINEKTGQFDENKINFKKSKAEEKIEELNKYAGEISKFLFGVELSLSFIFFFSVSLWIWLIFLVKEPLKSFLDIGEYSSIGVGTIVSILVMHSFGDNFVLWIDSIITNWKAGIISIILGYILSLFYKKIWNKWKKESEEEKEIIAKEVLKIAADGEKRLIKRK